MYVGQGGIKFAWHAVFREVPGDVRAEDPNETAKTLHKITRDPASWRIDAKGLSIVFQPYAVACYACTPQPFTMSWEQLRPLLNGEFVIPVKQ